MTGLRSTAADSARGQEVLHGPVPGRPVHDDRSLVPAALGITFVGVLGLLTLPVPFWGDQALFTVYARQLTEGAVLYRDVFDVKQPGIFLFYLAGGVLFGFTEVGIHLFELAYWLAFSVFALRAMRPYFASAWATALVPVFTAGTYYLYAGLLDLTQVEILVAFPLLVAWWLVDRAPAATDGGRGRYAAAGLAAAAVVLLKHLYLLIVLAFLAHALLRGWRRGLRIEAVRHLLMAFAAGMAVPLLLVTGYFAAHGQLGRIWWAYFEMAPAAQLLTPRPIEYLLTGARRFMIGHGPLLILATLGVVSAFRTGPGERRDLAAGMVLWGLAAFVAFIVLQGWPEYKWTIFTVPVGILAVCGIQALVAVTRSRMRRTPWMAYAAAGALGVGTFVASAPVPQLQTRLLVAVMAGCAAAAAIPFVTRGRAVRLLVQTCMACLAVTTGLAAIAPVEKFRRLAEHDFGVDAGARTRLQRSLNRAYRAADADLEYLRQRGGLPPTLYVFGDPVLLLRAERPQPVPILGWGPEFLDGKAWQQLHADLASTPPALIVVEDHIEVMIRDRYPAVLDWIASRYRLAFSGTSGTWYERLS